MASSISENHIVTLRAIAKAGFTYDTTKELAATNHWQLTDDELDPGYLRFDVELLTGEPPLSVVVEFGNEERPPFAFVGLFCFPDRNEHLSEFDNAFQSMAWELDRILGTPTISGEYSYSQQDWQYSYRWWSLPDAELVLVRTNSTSRMDMMSPSGSSPPAPQKISQCVHDRDLIPRVSNQFG